MAVSLNFLLVDETPPAMAASASSQALRFNRSTTRTVTAVTTGPPGPPAQLRSGNSEVRGPRSIDCMARALAASSGM